MRFNTVCILISICTPMKTTIIVGSSVYPELAQDSVTVVSDGHLGSGRLVPDLYRSGG